MKFVQRKFYIPEDNYTQMNWLAESQGKTITEVLRGFIEDGLKRRKKKNSFQALLELALKERKSGWKGPDDLAEKHDKYFAEAYGEK